MDSEQHSRSFSNSRRDFIKLAASGTAAVSALAAASASAADMVAVRPPENEPGPYNLLIDGVRCVDPETGLHAVRNVGIKGGRIAAMAKRRLN